MNLRSSCERGCAALRCQRHSNALVATLTTEALQTTANDWPAGRPRAVHWAVIDRWLRCEAQSGVASRELCTGVGRETEATLGGDESKFAERPAGRLVRASWRRPGR